MADTQSAPQSTVLPLPHAPGSTREAQEALLGLMEPEEEKPEIEEATPTEEEESTEEIQDESLEEEQPDESEEEEEGEEPDEVEESDEAEEAEEPDEEVRLYTVKVNGEDTEVSEDELIRGYSRQSDYTRKTQELAEERRTIEAAEAEYKSQVAHMQNERQQYIDAISQVMQASMAGVEQYSNVDWEALKAEDPIEYITKRDEYREMQERVRTNQHRIQQEQQKQSVDMQEARKRALHEEHGRLVEKVPEWGEPDTQKKLARDLREYAVEQGFSPEEIGSLIDHRSLVVLLKAQKYDALQKADVKSKKIKNKPKVVRAGKGQTSSSTNKAKKAAQMKRLKESGNVRDATALFEDFVELE